MSRRSSLDSSDERVPTKITARPLEAFHFTGLVFSQESFFLRRELLFVSKLSPTQVSPHTVSPNWRSATRISTPWLSIDSRVHFCSFTAIYPRQKGQLGVTLMPLTLSSSRRSRSCPGSFLAKSLITSGVLKASLTAAWIAWERVNS